MKHLRWGITVLSERIFQFLTGTQRAIGFTTSLWIYRFAHITIYQNACAEHIHSTVCLHELQCPNWRLPRDLPPLLNLLNIADQAGSENLLYNSLDPVPSEDSYKPGRKFNTDRTESPVPLKTTRYLLPSSHPSFIFCPPQLSTPIPPAPVD